MKGRKPHLNSVKRAQGKRIKNPNPPKPLSALTCPPDHLDEVARKEWNRLASMKDYKEVVSSWDMGVFAAYCQQFSLWVKACKEYNAEQLVVLSDKNKVPIRNVYMDIANKAADRMFKYAIELALTPIARQKIRVDESIKGKTINDDLDGEVADLLGTLDLGEE